MKRFTGILVLALLTVLPSFAQAHQGDPNYRSEITTISPSVDGLSFQTYNFDDGVRLQNDTGKEVVVIGYDGEPYVRISADGLVEVNLNSPSYYLNEDRFANAEVPASADPEAAPEWETVGSSGRLEFHDHRIHWMAQGTPPQVKDEGERTKVFDWTVPMVVDGKPTEIAGELFWVPEESGFPIAAIGALVAVALAALAFVIFVRRRRSRGGDGGGDSPPKEAW